MSDLISRQALCEYALNQKDKCVTPNDIMRFPSAQPERKNGKWIPVTNGRGGFECNRCHCYAPSYQDGVEWLSAFCPSCGCRMEGEQE